jgi:hypothetical protein
LIQAILDLVQKHNLKFEDFIEDFLEEVPVAIV